MMKSIRKLRGGAPGVGRSPDQSRRHRWAPALPMILLLATACIAPDVRTQATPLGDVSGFESFEWLPIEIVAGALDSDASLVNELTREGREGVVARGYEDVTVVGDAAALALQLTLRRVPVTRRTVSPDPDSNYPLERTLDEAVLGLVAIEPARGEVLWRGEARGVLPDREGVLGRSSEQVWRQGLAKLVERFPRR